MSFEDIRSKMLHPTDLFFHICIHGVQWNAIPPIRWIADAVSIYKNPSVKLDWERIYFLTETFSAGLPLLNGVKYLQKHYSLMVPNSTINHFEKINHSKRERRSYRIQTENPGKLGNIPKNLERYFSLKDGKNLFQKIFHLPRYLQYFYDLEHLVKLPGHIVKKFLW